MLLGDGMRFVKRKNEIAEGEYVYGPTSEQRYQELVNMFLLKLEEKRNGAAEEGHCYAQVWEDSGV